MTLILNTNLKAHNATTQYYNGVDINSMCKFNHKYLVASDDGLYWHQGNVDAVDGDSNNDELISAYFITATMDFGINNDKRIRYIYFSLEASDNLELTINTEKVSAITYTIPIIANMGQQDVRIPISRVLYGRFWTFKISNALTGADFSIDEIKIFPIIRTRTF